MSNLRELKNVLAFLTTIPVGMDLDGLNLAANSMYLFPLVGALIGLFAGSFAWILSLGLPNLLVGGLAVGFLLFITGVHHMDGLLDFGDGIAFRGSPYEKIQIMHDQHTGAGGLALGLIVVMLTALSMSELKPDVILQALIVAETAAKFAMVLEASAGRSAHRGMATCFVDAMHQKRGLGFLLVSLGITLGISILTLRLVGVLVVASVIPLVLFIVRVSHIHFQGITGDVLGATNELSRMLSLLVMVGAMRWL